MAVAFVLIFHLWPTRFSGGYIGVDMFFVISGYLITRVLVGQIEAERLSLTEFWARRARRLLPAAFTVLASVALCTFAWLPPGLWKQSFQEQAASALYVQNWKLAADATDYFASANLPSPVQHFWSLSVEEQFYFAVPVLLCIGSRWTRGRPLARRRRALLRLVLAVTLASFALCLLDGASQPGAYFSTPLRAWEFGVGALLSFTRQPCPAWLAQPCAWSGLLLCLAGGFGFDPQTPFPGPAALVPALGTAAVIWAGDSSGRFAPARLARNRWLLFLGDSSYSIYLWHWPLIVLAPLVLGRALGFIDKLGIAAASLLLAGLTTRWIERPIRFPRPTAKVLRPRVVAIWSAAGMALVLSLSGTGLVRSAWAETASAAVVSEVEARQPACFGAAAMRPGSRACVNPELAQTLVPQPDLAHADTLVRPDCRASGGALMLCTLGPERGYAKRLAAIGDSHTAALLPAYEKIATMMNWRIDVASKNACYWTSALQSNPNREEIEDCQQWKAELNRKLASSEPYEAILVTHRVGAFQPQAGSEAELREVIVGGLVEAWQTQTARGSKIIAIRDNPTSGAERTACVAQHLLQANQACGLDRNTALASFDGHLAATQRVPGSYLVDLSDYYCDASQCPAIIGGVLVYRDGNHITATFARTLAPALLSQLRKILG